MKDFKPPIHHLRVRMKSLIIRSRKKYITRCRNDLQCFWTWSTRTSITHLTFGPSGQYLQCLSSDKTQLIYVVSQVLQKQLRPNYLRHQSSSVQIVSHQSPQSVHTSCLKCTTLYSFAKYIKTFKTFFTGCWVEILITCLISVHNLVD